MIFIFIDFLLISEDWNNGLEMFAQTLMSYKYSTEKD